MTRLTYVPPARLPEPFDLQGVDELIVEHQALSRFGTADDDTTHRLLRQAKASGCDTVLAWDLLCSDGELANGAAALRRLDLGLVDAVRTLDPGVASYVKESFPNLDLHLILETGNHNTEGIASWARRLKPARLMLSNEVPLNTIADIRQVVDTPIEIQILGRLLIFSSPRPLLPKDPTPEALTSYIVDEEDQKRFPVVKNQHGFFMFYEKDLYLAPYLKAIEAAGVDAVRADLRFYEPEAHTALLAWLHDPKPENLETLAGFLGPKRTRGFFKSNRTDKQFAKLTNPHLRKDTARRSVGEVVETAKKRHLALLLEAPIQVGDQLSFVIPEGEELTDTVVWLSDLEGNRIERCETGLCLMNHVRRISSGSRVYLNA